MSELLTPGLGAPVPEPEPEPEPVEPAWQGPSQDEWGSVMGYIQQQQAERDAYAQQQQAQQSQQQYAVDPFADDFGQQLQTIIGQAVQQNLAPVMEYQYGQQLGEAHERALDILDSIVSRDGEFINQDKAFEASIALANSYMQEESAKHGYGPKAAEAALTRAAGEIRAYETAVAEAAQQRYMNQLSNLGGAARDVYGAPLAASEGFSVPDGGDEYAVLERFGGFSGGGR